MQYSVPVEKEVIFTIKDKNNVWLCMVCIYKVAVYF